MIAHRIDGPHDVHDVGILERANHVHHGIDFPDLREELIAEALALRGALDQAGDVHELHDCGHLFLGFDDRVEPLEPGIGNFDNADIRLDSAERVVLRRRRF